MAMTVHFGDFLRRLASAESEIRKQTKVGVLQSLYIIQAEPQGIASNFFISG